MSNAENSDAKYQLIPIPGMERVRKNFEAIRDASDDISLACEKLGHVSLSTRFMLMERGYLLSHEQPESVELKVTVGEAEEE